MAVSLISDPAPSKTPIGLEELQLGMVLPAFLIREGMIVTEGTRKYVIREVLCHIPGSRPYKEYGRVEPGKIWWKVIPRGGSDKSTSTWVVESTGEWSVHT